jgi:Uncharacterised protein domain (DUF2415)
MTISSQELYQVNTESLASLERFYPTKISVQHHQLRHLVSVSDGERVYYVNCHDVYVLDLQTSQSTLLATVRFQARCLAADHGWVCVGGESDGNCAFIRIEEPPVVPRCFSANLSVDVLGGDIVNSMNIHLLLEDNESEPEPVVLISNNDRTVKVFSLAQREVLDTLEHDKPMNYATLSPDSKILAAVGDSDKVYFYKRRKIEQGEGKWQSSSPYPEYDWRPFAVPTVPTGDDVHDDHGFAVTFSPSGHLCAASSQGGAISVFDMSLLVDRSRKPEDSILCTFRSSRPTLWGCVRAMTFSPRPWDLLAWAEDHGKIGVADVRQMFIRRQSLDLDKAKAQTVHVKDITPVEYRDLGLDEKLEQQDLARPQTRRGPLSLHDRNESLVQEAQAILSQRRQRRQDILSRAAHVELDARERSVLEALETTMDDVEQSHQPYSLNYSSSPRFRPGSNSDAVREYDVQLLNPDRRSGPRVHQPRRRTSVVLSESTQSRHLIPVDSPRARISASPGRMTDDEEIPAMSTNDLTPTRTSSTAQPRPYDIPPSDPWHVIQAALETARRPEITNTSINDDRAPSLAQIEAALEAERRLGNQLERQLADERQLSNLLRLQLDSQERLLQSQQQELQAERDTGSRSDPSPGHLLHRELETEQHFGQQRSQELETEIRLGSNRARRLEAERTRILTSASQNNLIRPQQDQVNTAPTSAPTLTSAQTTTLPTASTLLTDRLPTPALPSSSTASQDSLSLTLQRHEAFRRQREAHIENLERQVRRAESRVATASSDIQALESAIQRGVVSDRIARQTELVARAHAAASAANNPSIRERHRERMRSAISANPDAAVAGLDWRQPIPRVEPPTRTSTSELSNRVTESEMRAARLMFLGRANLDANGNWVAGAGLQRVMAQAASAVGGSETTGTTTVADVVRQMGVGTAGLSWSRDGTRL